MVSCVGSASDDESRAMDVIVGSWCGAEDPGEKREGVDNVEDLFWELGSGVREIERGSASINSETLHNPAFPSTLINVLDSSRR
jgi:hypothetical protein